MEAYVLDWLNLLVRWLHFIAGIAWIGASFYFVMLDNSLSRPKKPEDARRGVSGELWAVHGGGFYCSQKYLTGPKGEPLSENLHWSKWEAYTTWLSGVALLALIYWLGASSYLIDRNVMPLTPATAIAISIASLAGGWLVYDGLCRALEGHENVLAALIFAFVMLCAWALFYVFSARAAYIHVGAILGTIMVANVFFHIIPGQKRMVADIRAGREPIAFAKVQGVLKERCLQCHAAQPTQPGFAQPPKGIVLETPEQVAANAPKVAETVGNKYMPIGNLTQMTDEERALIVTWFAQGAPTK